MLLHYSDGSQTRGFTPLIYGKFQYHASSDGSQTYLFDLFYTDQFQYPASSDGFQTSLADVHGQAPLSSFRGFRQSKLKFSLSDGL